MAEALTQYKLIVLYMLEKADCPLTNTQISTFILEKEYTTYFTLQQILNELLSSELLRAETTHSNTLYHLTPAGRETLSYFPDKISEAIKEDVLSFFEKNQVHLKQETLILADYYKTINQVYMARCQIKERELPLVDLTLKAGSKEQAEAICENWRNQTDEVYTYLMDLLLR